MLLHRWISIATLRGGLKRHICRSNPRSPASLGRAGFVLIALWATPSAWSGANEYAIDTSTSQISIKDAGGHIYRLMHSIRDQFNESGGIEPSHDGQRLAFSVQTFPVLDEAHPKSGGEFAYSDGTPGDRRGNRLMLVGVSQRSGDDGVRLLGAPTADTWSPSWSPDDKSIAFYSNEGGAVQVWAYEIASATRRKLSDDRIRVQLGTAMDAPSWSADGTAVFVSKVTARVNDGKSPRPDPYRGSPGDAIDARSWAIEHSDRDVAESTLVSINVHTGEEVSLPSNGPINFLHSLSRSPSGRWLAALTDDYQVSVIDLSTMESHRLGEMTVLGYKNDYYAGPFWSPRSDIFGYVSGNQLRVLDLTNGFKDPSVVGSNLDNVAWHYDGGKVVFLDTMNPPAFSSDGLNILALVLRNDVAYLRVIPIDGSRATQFPLRGGQRVNRDIDDQMITGEVSRIDLLRARANEAWQADQDHVFVQYTDYDTAEVVVDEVSIATGKAQTSLRMRADFRVVGAIRDGNAIALYQDFFTPGNFYKLTKKLKRDPGAIVPLDVSSTLISMLRAARVSVISTTAPTREGRLRRLTAVVVRPGKDDGKPGPAVVGEYPGYQGFWEINRFPDSFSFLYVLPIESYLKNGYTVVLPDTLGRGPYRQPMEAVETRGVVDSLLSQIYRAADLGLLDVRRVGIIGESQGGHAAIAATTGTNLFRAAVSVNGVRFAPIEHWTSIAADSSHYIGATQLSDGLVRMFDNAPYFHAGSILTPIMLVHGDADPTFHSSELMAEALRTRNAIFEFLPYQHMAHDPLLWPKAEQIDLTTRILGFFDKHLSN